MSDVPIRVGIDAEPLMGQRAGIGRYVGELCEQLDALLPCAHFFAYSRARIACALPSTRWAVRSDTGNAASALPSYWWLKLRAGRLAEADHLDVYWATRTVSPRLRGTPIIATVHDLNYLLVPESMPPATRIAHRLWFSRDVKAAAAIVTNSAGTAARLSHMLGVKANDIARPGVGSAFRPASQGTIQARLRDIGVHQPYILSVSTLEPRKNLKSLISAYEFLRRQQGALFPPLYLTGQVGWKSRGLMREIAKCGDSVRWLGFVNDSDLATLYAGAAAYICPSLYEGFGIPVLEARACGTTIVATDLPELREAGGPNGIYVSPSPESLAQGITQALALRSPAEAPDFANDWGKAGTIMANTLLRISKVTNPTLA